MPGQSDLKKIQGLKSCFFWVILNSCLAARLPARQGRLVFQDLCDNLTDAETLNLIQGRQVQQDFKVKPDCPD